LDALCRYSAFVPPENNAESRQHASEPVPDFNPLGNELSASAKHEPDCMTVEAFNSDVAIPASLYNLCQAVSVTLVGFAHLHVQCRL
jgi:hypothetical protein